MNRREFLLSGTFFLATSGVASATQSEDDLALRLRQEGFRITERKRTWLGRIKIRARNGKTLREVVLDPTSGEVLRDYSEDLSTEQSRSGRRISRDDTSGGSGSGAEEPDRSGGSGGSGGGSSSGGGSGGGSTGGGETGGSETGGGETGGGETGGTEAKETKEQRTERKGKKEGSDVLR